VPTPVGPAPRDPNDPDLWEEWYEPDDGTVPRSRFGWPVRILAIVVVVTLAVLIILGG
jgi:hypothetical protein